MREFELIRSGRRTVSIEIAQGPKVRVRAPMKMSRRSIDAIVHSHEAWIVKHLALAQARQESAASATEEELNDLWRMAWEQLPAKAARFAEIMGLSPRKVGITSAKKRFGSCSASGNINFSFRLMAFPEAAIDYVVVHELAHLLHHDHSAAFYALIERYLPDYRERRGLLRSRPMP